MESDNNVDEIFSSSLMPESSDPIDVGLANAISDYTSSLSSISSYNYTGEVNAKKGVKEIFGKELKLPLLKKTRVLVPLESPRRELKQLIQARKNSSNFSNEGSFVIRFRNYFMMKPNSSKFSEDYCAVLGKCLRKYSNSFSVTNSSKRKARILLNKCSILLDFFVGQV